MKRQYNTPEMLVKGLPPEFTNFMNYLKTLDYSDEPNYDYLTGLLRGSLEKFGGSEKECVNTTTLCSWYRPFAWESQPPPNRFLRVVNSTASSFSSTGSSIGVTVSLMCMNLYW